MSVGLASLHHATEVRGLGRCSREQVWLRRLLGDHGAQLADTDKPVTNQALLELLCFVSRIE
jgi:hypothetical protein